MLFLAFSFFVIAAAVMLVVLLFRLGIEQRAKHVGLLLALGFRPRQITRLLAGEGLLVAIAGSLIGTLAGVGYAALMLFGLRTWWLPAIGTPFLTLHVSWQSPAIGLASGLLDGPGGDMACRPAAWAASRRGGCWRERRGREGGRRSRIRKAERRFKQLVLSISLLSPLLPSPASSSSPSLPPPSSCSCRWAKTRKSGPSSARARWRCVSLLTLVYLQLRRGATGPAVARGRGNLLRMALRNAARNPGRSALAIGLTASACFLIAAVSVFRIDPARQAADRTSGSGGFALIGQSELPIHFDLDTPQGRKEMGFDPDQEDLLAKCRFYAFRVKSGDEASCLNLYQPRQPRLLGVGPQFIARGGFAWADAPDMPNPWQLLAPDAPRQLDGRDEGPDPRRARSDDRQLRARSLEGTRRDTSPSTTPTIARSICKSPGC